MKRTLLPLLGIFISFSAFSQQPCYDPLVIDTSIICTTIYNPVCGCDSVTYPNSCVAYYYHGITSWTSGPCNASSNCHAFFSYQKSGNTVAFVDGSSSGTQLVYWHWTFGDGASSTFQNTSHTYSSAGTYLVCLTVVAADSCTSTYCDTITIGTSTGCINPQQIDTTVACPTVYAPVCGCDSVTYNNSCEAWYWYGVTSWTNGPCSGTVSCHADFFYHTQQSHVYFTDISTASGQIVHWYWDFGDGQSSNFQHPSHTYGNSGQYLVCLTITTIDSCVSTYCDTITIGSSSCHALYTVDSVQALTVTWDDVSTGNIISWWWAFGDGNYSTNANPTHTYLHSGKYLVCLTVVASDSCVSTYCDSLNLIHTGHIADISLMNEIKLFPNPTSSHVSINLPDQTMTSVEVRVTGITGYTVSSIITHSPRKKNTLFEWQNPGLPPGMYLFEIITSLGRKTIPLVIMN